MCGVTWKEEGDVEMDVRGDVEGGGDVEMDVRGDAIK